MIANVFTPSRREPCRSTFRLVHYLKVHQLFSASCVCSVGNYKLPSDNKLWHERFLPTGLLDCVEYINTVGGNVCFRTFYPHFSSLHFDLFIILQFTKILWFLYIALTSIIFVVLTFEKYSKFGWISQPIFTTKPKWLYFYEDLFYFRLVWVIANQSSFESSFTIIYTYLIHQELLDSHL